MTSPYKGIGDSLTDAEFYTFVALVRANNPVLDKFDITENTINKEYYTLLFTFDDCTVLDNGIMVTDKTRANPPMVKLNDVIFKHSNHTLNLKVMDIDDYRLSDTDTSSMEYETISLALEENMNTSIPLTGLNNGMVILFDDAELMITHDKPTIVVIDDE